MRQIRKTKLRSVLVATAAIAALATVGAGSASAAATLHVTTDNNNVGELTSVSIQTALTGSGTAKRQYGANITIPAALRLSYYYFGGQGDMCPGGSYSTTSTGLGNVQAFSKANCPARAKIGTVQLGNASGSIYAVNSTPIPTAAVYFDSGVSTPYGRRINATYDSNSNMTLSIAGLANASTSGLTLNFSNPGRDAGLSPKVWEWVEPGDTGCVASSQATATVLTWPSFVIPGLSKPGSTTATPATINLTGCEYAFYLMQNTNVVSENLELRTMAMNFTNESLYGQVIDLPSSVWLNFPAWGGPRCPANSFSAISTGITPAATGFNAANCPAGSAVGTVQLGAQTGKIYMVSASPMNQFALWFDQGVTTPYGVRLNITWPSETEGVHTTRLWTYGLKGGPGDDLTLDFDPPAPGQSSIFDLAPTGTVECATAYATSRYFTYPTSGTAAGVRGPFTSRSPLVVTGC